MRGIRIIVEVGTVCAAVIGMATAPSYLAQFARGFADWVEGGGNYQIFLGAIVAPLLVLIALEVRAWRSERKAAKDATGARNAPPSSPSSLLPSSPSSAALREARRREAEAKAQSDLVDSEFRTFGYKLNAVLGGMFGLPSRGDGTDRDRKPDEEEGRK